MFKCVQINESKTIDTPLEPNARYSMIDSVPLLDMILYHSIVGSLVYLTVTRPDMTRVVHVVSQFVIVTTTIHCRDIFVVFILRVSL